GYVLGTVVQDPFMYGFESVRILQALNRGDAAVLPKDGILSIPGRVIRKDTADAFWKDLKAKLEAGKAGRAPA
ncbi:MAG: sugar ABC transporter substrate-binding protein, partial [Phycisphaerales bacterium]